MSSRNFVGASGDGYDVYVNGVRVGHYGSLSEAQNAYNQAGGPAAEAQEAAQATPQQPGSPGTATAGGTPATGVAGAVGAAEATYALNAYIAYQTAKNNADRLNLLDIPAWQKQAAIADADLKLRQATEARAALNDEQRRQLDAQTGALEQARVFGYGSSLGQGTGNRLITAAADLRANPDYRALAQRVAAGDPTAAAAKRQMEIGIIANATGLPMDRAQALGDALNARRDAMGGALMGGEEIDRLLAQDPSFQTPTLAREQYGTETALKYLDLRRQMQGPENAFAYAQTIRDTPASVRALINQAAQRAGIAGLGYPGGGPGGGAAVGGAPGTVSAAVMPGGEVLGPGTMTNQRAVSDVDPVTGMTRAGQINPLDYQRSSDYLKKMIWSGYGAVGADPEQKKEEYYRSLPKYGGATTGTLRRA